jgi:hypothetical protein
VDHARRFADLAAAVAISEDNGRRTALIRFTGTGWDTRDWIDTYARCARSRVVTENAATSDRYA